MSKISDSVYEQLVQGNSPAAVRASVTSNSQFATGLQKYLTWSVSKVRSIQGEIASLQFKQRELVALTTSLQAQHNELARSFEDLTQRQVELSKNTQKQSANLQGLQLKSSQTEASLRDFEARRQELHGKGYTDVIISRLSASDAAHGGEMLSRVQTVEKYEKEVRDQQTVLEKQKSELEKAKQDRENLRVSSEATREELDKLSDRLHRKQDEERLFESSIKIVKSLVDGYGLENQDFQNMLNLVNRIGSPGMSGKTMENVSATLTGYQTLAKLEAAIKGKKEALDEVEANLGKSEERLNASTKAFAEASNRINQLAENVRATVNETLEKTRGNLGRLEESAIATLKKVASETHEKVEIQRVDAAKSLTLVGDQGKNKIQAVVEQCSAVLEEIRKVSEVERQRHKEVLEEWGKINVMIGSYSHDIQIASALFAVKQDQEALNMVDKGTIMLLLTRVSQWSKQRIWRISPKAETRATFGGAGVYLEQFVEFGQALGWAQIALSKGQALR